MCLVPGIKWIYEIFVALWMTRYSDQNASARLGGRHAGDEAQLVVHLFSVYKVMVVTTHTAYMGPSAQPKHLEPSYKRIGTASSSSNI